MARLLNSDPYSALTCSVCFGDFDDPRALPCLHTFCLKCLIGVYDARQGVMACPCCREPCAARPQDLRRDFRIAKMLEMRPLLEMGLEVLEGMTLKAQTLLGSLTPACELRQVTRQCDEDLRRLRQEQIDIDKIFDSHLERCQTVIRDQRAAARKSIEERRSELQARRRWAAESLDLRSASEALLQSVGGGGGGCDLDDGGSCPQQSVQDSVARFRQRSAAPVRQEPEVSKLEPTRESVRGDLRAALAQIDVADVTSRYARAYQKELEIRSEQASSGEDQETSCLYGQAIPRFEKC